MSGSDLRDARRILDLALALQAPGRGMCIEDIEDRFGVDRLGAERLRRAVHALFPELRSEPGDDGRVYWKLRRGRANELIGWSVDEIAALEAAVRWARHRGDAQREVALRSVAEKVKALIGPPDLSREIHVGERACGALDE